MPGPVVTGDRTRVPVGLRSWLPGRTGVVTHPGRTISPALRRIGTVARSGSPRAELARASPRPTALTTPGAMVSKAIPPITAERATGPTTDPDAEPGRRMMAWLAIGARRGRVQSFEVRYPCKFHTVEVGPGTTALIGTKLMPGRVVRIRKGSRFGPVDPVAARFMSRLRGMSRFCEAQFQGRDIQSVLQDHAMQLRVIALNVVNSKLPKHGHGVRVFHALGNGAYPGFLRNLGSVRRPHSLRPCPGAVPASGCRRSSRSPSARA